MADHAKAMRDQVLFLLPTAADDYQDTLAKPNRIFVVVRKHPVPFQQDELPDVENYLWFKATTKKSIDTILGAYRQRWVDDTLAVEFQTADGSIAQTGQKMTELGLEDQLVILTAITPQSTESFFNTPEPKPRTPLQPIQRQLTVPPMQSVEQPTKSPTFSKSVPPMAPPHAYLPPNVSNGYLPPNVSNGYLPPNVPNGYLPPNATNGYLPHRSPSHAHVKPELPDDAAMFLPPVFASAAQSSFANQSAPSHTEPLPKEEPVDDLDDETQAYEPRDQGNPFAASQDDADADISNRGIALQELTNENVPERLEAGVTAGLKILSDIEAPLKDLQGNEDTQAWLEAIERVRKEAVKTRTVVGVVGNTGAGKSSVINAMLDEERLVPTNCMRACTAVVTELSYNDSTNPLSKYRAAIEFIKPDEWSKELETLFKEIFDDGDNFSKEISNPDSTAGIAYAKIRAVYFKHTREMLQRSSVDSLMKQKHVKNVLGQSKNICEEDPARFYKRLQQYVDSKEKGTEKLDKNGNKAHNQRREFEQWPLIKVVKIYTKAEALATGAVIVDLPGVHDSNAARAAVAEGYMKQCTGLWIVAPITRAVDDKAAKSLLGDTFKRQLKFDGTYSAVTFICSKTDDISIIEASDTLQLGDQMAELQDEQADIEARRQDLEKQIKKIKSDKSDHEATLEQLEESIEAWEELEAKAASGKTVYPPKPSKKRKKTSISKPSKRRRRSVDTDDDDEISHSSRRVDEDVEATEGSDEPLTEDAIATKLDEMKQVKKEARREKNLLVEQLSEMREKLDVVEVQAEEAEAKRSAICIAGRNEYSRGAIQQDFAAGIKELDQETAAEEDPDNFDPDQDIRDYDEVAKSLPVFCVSSRAYQKLSGRHKKDSDVEGFTDIQETEIPQLQAHCKKLTENGRQATCRKFLNNLKQLLTSLGLWASDDGTGIKMTSQQRDAEKAFLAKKLKELETALEKAVKNTLEDAVTTLDDELFSRFHGAVRSAVGDAIPTSSGWGAPKQEGGLVWATYKATVRRSGVFQGSAGLRDFNNELVEPMYKQLSNVWEKAFQRRVPHILRSFTKSATSVIKNFHSAVEQRCREKGVGIARVSMIGTQLEAYQGILSDLAATAMQSLNDGQRDLNREFTPVITAIMSPVYDSCAGEVGRGQYQRMKSMMAGHVQQQQQHMFQNAADHVKTGLINLCKTIRETMLDKSDEVFVNMQRDYKTVVGIESGGEIKMSREERATRREVDTVLNKADAPFREVLDADLDSLKAKYWAVELKDETGEPEEIVDDEMDLHADGTDDEAEEDDDEQAAESGDEMDRCADGASNSGAGAANDEED